MLFVKIVIFKFVIVELSELNWICFVLDVHLDHWHFVLQQFFFDLQVFSQLSVFDKIEIPAKTSFSVAIPLTYKTLPEQPKLTVQLCAEFFFLLN